MSFSWEYLLSSWVAFSAVTQSHHSKCYINCEGVQTPVFNIILRLKYQVMSLTSKLCVLHFCSCFFVWSKMSFAPLKYCQNFSGPIVDCCWLLQKHDLQPGARSTGFKLSIFAVPMSKEKKAEQASTSNLFLCDWCQRCLCFLFFRLFIYWGFLVAPACKTAFALSFVPILYFNLNVNLSESWVSSFSWWQSVSFLFLGQGGFSHYLFPVFKPLKRL